MLIVMTIMLVLVVIALPTVKRVMEDGNVREASRQLNAYFAMAKARALQTGRPCGIMMICDLPLGITDVVPAQNQIPPWPTKQVTTMYLAEVPAPYSGSTIGAVAKIADPTGMNGQRQFMPIIYNASGGEVFDTIWNSANAGQEGPVLANLIAPGETFLVRFSNKGEWYQCMRGTAGNSAGYTNPAVLYFLGGASTAPPGYNDTSTFVSGAKTYQIVRIARRIGNPLQLTTGTCIDLAYCGIGPSNLAAGTLTAGMYQPTAVYARPNIAGYGLAPLQEVIVMFTPGGGIETIQLRSPVFNEVIYPTTTVHFLIGRADKLTANPTQAGSSPTHPTGIAMFDTTLSNLADPNSLWVSVSRSTGNVVTADNLPPPITSPTPNSATLYSGSSQQQTINPSNAAGQVTYLSYCRQLATNRDQIRGQ
jgi:hypothetical protein